MKSLAAEAVDPSRRLSVPDAGGCDNTKPNPGFRVQWNGKPG